MEKEKSCKCIEDKSSHHSCELYDGISKEYLPTYIKLKQSGVINNDGCVSLNGEMVPYYFLNDDCTNFPDHSSKVLWKICKKEEEEKPKQEPNPSFDFVIDIIKNTIYWLVFSSIWSFSCKKIFSRHQDNDGCKKNY